MIKWWDKREENEVAWKVKVEDLKDGFDLDVKNPTLPVEDELLGKGQLIAALRKSQCKVDALLSQLEES